MTVQLRRMWIQLTADRKRFGVLCGVIAVALLLWSRIIVISNVPRTAVAEDHPEADVVAERLLGALNWSENDSLRPATQVTLERRPRRDPFVISIEHFPKPEAIDTSAEDRDKSAGEPAENAEAREARITARLRELVEGLSLEAVMSGPPPMALIDGVSYRVGDAVPAGTNDTTFTLVEVGQRRVVLEIQERRFTLDMKSPVSR